MDTKQKMLGIGPKLGNWLTFKTMWHFSQCPDDEYCVSVSYYFADVIRTSVVGVHICIPINSNTDRISLRLVRFCKNKFYPNPSWSRRYGISYVCTQRTKFLHWCCVIIRLTLRWYCNSKKYGQVYHCTNPPKFGNITTTTQTQIPYKWFVVYVVSLKSGVYSVFVTALLYLIMSNIWPRYKGTRQYCIAISSSVLTQYLLEKLRRRNHLAILTLIWKYGCHRLGYGHKLH